MYRDIHQMAVFGKEVVENVLVHTYNSPSPNDPLAQRGPCRRTKGDIGSKTNTLDPELFEWKEE